MHVVVIDVVIDVVVVDDGGERTGSHWRQTVY